MTLSNQAQQMPITPFQPWIGDVKVQEAFRRWEANPPSWQWTAFPDERLHGPYGLWPLPERVAWKGRRGGEPNALRGSGPESRIRETRSSGLMRGGRAAKWKPTTAVSSTPPSLSCLLYLSTARCAEDCLAPHPGFLDSPVHELPRPSRFVPRSSRSDAELSPRECSLFGMRVTTARLGG